MLVVGLDHSSVSLLVPACCDQNLLLILALGTERFECVMQVVYFVNSGSEANDMAMMMARLYTGSFDIVALRNAYHGMSPSTMGLTAHSTWKYNVAQVSGSNSTRIQSPASSECTLLSQSGLHVLFEVTLDVFGQDFLR